MNDTNTFSELRIIEPRSPFKSNTDTDQKLFPENHSNFTALFRELNRFRMTGTLCDCVLATTDGASFRVHKVVMALCSDYFRTLFTTTLADEKGDDSPDSRKFYRIPNVSSVILESILNFAYCGTVQIDENNVTELLSTADQFNVVGIVNECIDFLLRKMTPENCIGVYRFGKEYFIPKLEKEVKRYILEHFVQITNTDEFLNMKMNLLKDILQDNALNVPNEYFVWMAIKRWCMHKYMKRQDCIPDLFRSVRLALLTVDQFKQIMNDPRVFRHLQCRNYINMISKYILSKFQELSKDIEDNGAVSIFTPRYPYEVILASGGWTITGPTNVLEIYDYKADLWKMIFSDEFSPRAYHQTLCLGEYIYILGGSSGQDHLNTCWRFNVTSIRFEEISHMQEQRCFLSATIVNGKIYAIGGFDGEDRLNTAEFYDEEQNQWIYISPMNEKRSDAGASSLRGRIFVVGGYNGVEFLQSAECYFVEFDQWFLLSPMVQCRSGPGCVAVDNAIYAIGGYDGENRLKSVEKYCFFQSQWFATKPMKHPRSNFAVAILNNRIYVMGGYDDIADDTSDQAEFFDLTHPEWRSIASLNVGRSGFSACTISGITRITPYIKDDCLRSLLKNASKEKFINNDGDDDNNIGIDEIRSALQMNRNVFV